MYERFTDRARKVMQLANQEAVRFNHEYIGTEHVLLGLVKEGSGVAANVLKNLDVDPRKIRAEIERIVQHGPAEGVSASRLPHTPRTKKVIEYSVEEAKKLNHTYVGTEHLLLGLLREEEGVAAQVLMNLGLKLADVRGEVLLLLGHEPRSTDSPRTPERPAGSPTRALDGFGRDLTLRARQGQFDVPPGRAADVDRVLHQLLRSRVFPLVVGDRDDVRAVVEGVAHRIAVLAPDLNEFRLVELLPDALDASNSTQVAERAMAVVSEAARSPAVWLAVRSPHPFGRTHAGRAANDRFRVLVSAGRLRVLWSVTPGEQAELFADADLTARLVPVPLSDPSAAAVTEQVVRATDQLRATHQVKIPDAAVAEAVRLGRTRAGALGLLDDAAAAVRLRRRVAPASRTTTDDGVTAEDVRTAAGVPNPTVTDSDASVVVESGA